MFRLSKGSEYAILGLLYMSAQPGRSLRIEEISKASEVPAHYLAKLFKILTNRGILFSTRGRDGGFVMARPPGGITLLDVVEAIDGPLDARCTGEGNGPKPVDRRVLPVLQECVQETERVLRSYSIERLSDGDIIL